MMYTQFQDDSNQHQQQKDRIFCPCGRSFLYERFLTYHKKWECGKKLECPNCSRVFNTLANLKSHTLKYCRFRTVNLDDSKDGKKFLPLK